MNALWLVLAFLLFLLLGTPVGYALGFASFFYLLFLNHLPLIMVAQRLTASLDNFVLMAVPFFILAGNLMNTGGITDRLVRFAMNTVGHVRGGLAHTTIVTNMIMAGMSGSAVADCAGTGIVLIPAMQKEGYPSEVAAGVTASAATIGPIIPPSIPMVLYGAMAGASITKLFVAGFLPGVLMGLALMTMVYLRANRWGLGAHRRASFAEWLRALWHALLPLGLPGVIMGGILFGVFTPTEAAAIAAVYAAALGTFVYHEMGAKSTLLVARDSLYRTATVLFIFANAVVFSWLITVERVPDLASNWVLGVTHSPALVLLIINVFLLIAGCLLDPTPILLITVPVLAPLASKVGIDLVHFGVVMVLNLMIGLLMPPMGLNLYIVSDISHIPYSRALRGTAPFVVPLLIVLALITYVPQVVMWLPGLLLK